MSELRSKDVTDLEQQLAQCSFDLLFIQTQLEASPKDAADSEAVRRFGESRLARIREKMEAIKQILFEKETEIIRS